MLWLFRRKNRKAARFNGLLRAEFTAPQTWVLIKRLTFKSDKLSRDDIRLLIEIGANITRGGTVWANKGFSTNLASVPRLLWGLISPWDVARAAVIHDQLYAACIAYYQSDRCDPNKWQKARFICDRIFLLSMHAAEPKIAVWRKYAAYYAVRLFGAKAAMGAENTGAAGSAKASTTRP